MDFFRALYDPFTPLYFFIALALFLHIFAWLRLNRRFWERMTQLSCVVAVIGLIGLAGSGRMNFAEEILLQQKSNLDAEYQSAIELAHRFAKFYTDEVFDLNKVHPEYRDNAKEAGRYFSRAVELLDRGYTSNAWRELLKDDRPMHEMTREDRIELERRMAIRSADERVFVPVASQKDLMLSELRGVARTENIVAEFEGARKRRIEEILLSLLWPYLVGISLAIQLAKASATIRSFAEPTFPSSDARA